MDERSDRSRKSIRPSIVSAAKFARTLDLYAAQTVSYCSKDFHAALNASLLKRTPRKDVN